MYSETGPLPDTYHCCGRKLREKSHSMIILSVPNLILIPFIILFVCLYFMARDQYSHSTEVLLKVTNTTKWQANIFGCIKDHSHYPRCDDIKSNMTLIKLNPNCIDNRNETCNITISYFITFTFKRGYDTPHMSVYTVTFATTCPFPRFNPCYEKFQKTVNCTSAVIYRTDSPTHYILSDTDPNYGAIIIVLIILSLFSACELGVLIFCIRLVNYYYRNENYLQKERNMRLQEIQQSDSLLNLDILMEMKEPAPIVGEQKV